MIEATLMIQYEDGTVKASIFRNAGNPSRDGKILQKYYNTKKRAEALINLGFLLSLEKRLAPKKGERHSLTYPAKDVTKAYLRDGGTFTSSFLPKTYANLIDAHQCWGETCLFYVFDVKTKTWKGNDLAVAENGMFDCYEVPLLSIEKMVD